MLGSQVSSEFLVREFWRKKFLAIGMYSLNHIVRNHSVGSTLLVNQYLIDVFLFNTPNNEAKPSYVRPLMKVKLGGRELTHPAGDPGMVGGGAELFTQSAMGILPHLLSPGLRLDLIFNIMLNKEFQWDKWERQTFPKLPF